VARWPNLAGVPSARGAEIDAVLAAVILCNAPRPAARSVSRIDTEGLAAPACSARCRSRWDELEFVKESRKLRFDMRSPARRAGHLGGFNDFMRKKGRPEERALCHARVMTGRSGRDPQRRALDDPEDMNIVVIRPTRMSLSQLAVHITSSAERPGDRITSSPKRSSNRTSGGFLPP